MELFFENLGVLKIMGYFTSYDPFTVLALTKKILTIWKLYWFAGS